MSPIEWEMVLRLVAAYPEYVPYAECVTLSNGDRGGQDRAGSVASEVRSRLGQDAITTVFRRGVPGRPAPPEAPGGPLLV